MNRLLALLAVLGLACSMATAAPLSVRIDDHDFTFDSDFVASYAYNGSQPDTLTVGAAGTAPANDVGSYRYLGVDPQFGGPGVGFFPVWGSSAPVAFGGNLQLSMSFNTNDGPYVDAFTSDRLPVSLTGATGHLTITGILGVPPGFTPPANSTPTVLLDITFTKTSLLSRDAGSSPDNSVIDLIEGAGTVNTILGQNVSTQNITGVAFMKFFATPGSTLFPSDKGVGPGAIGQPYNPLAATNQAAVTGRVSGEAGLGIFTLPEPASMALLAIGIPMLLRRRH